MLFQRIRIDRYYNGSKAYVRAHYERPEGSGVQFYTTFDPDAFGTKGKDAYHETIIRDALKKDTESSSQAAVRTIRSHIDKSFVDKMIEIIDRKKMRDAEVYKAAQIDRRLFSKIVSDRSYKPAKDTCIALALALQLTKPEALDLLSRAGYTLSHSDVRDVVIEYFFAERIYRLIDVNLVLDKYGLKPIGR